VRGRPQRVIPVTTAGAAGQARAGLAAGCAQHVRKAGTVDGSNLIFIVMAIVIQICLCTGAVPALTVSSNGS
jgi:hypothetical protein